MSENAPETPDAAPSRRAARRAARRAGLPETAVPGSAVPARAAGAASAPAAPASRAVAPGSAPAAETPLVVSPRIEPASPDVDVTVTQTPLPGAHRGGFTRPPTTPVGVVGVGALDGADGEEPEPYEPHLTPPLPPPTNLASMGLGFAIVGLIASFVVGWAFPLGIVGLVCGVRSLRRGTESRAVAVWAIALAVLSVFYSVGWLVWAAFQAGLFG